MPSHTTIIHVPRTDASPGRSRTDGGWRRWSAAAFGVRRVSPAALSVSLFHASCMLRAGVPMLDTLDDLVAQERQPRVRELWRRVRSEVTAGQTLVGALARSGSGLNAGCLAALAAGEAAGALGPALADVEQQLRWSIDMRRRLKNALIYPLLTLGVITAVGGWLLLRVAPSLHQMSTTLHALSGDTSTGSAGAGTQSAALIHSLLFWTVGGLGLALSLIILFGGMHTRTALWRSAFTLRMPVLGSLHLQAQCAGFCQVMASMMNQGVGLLAAWPLAHASVSHALLRDELNRVYRAVLDGVPVGQAVHSAHSLPGIVIRLINAGDSAGALDAAFAQAGEQLSRGLRHELARLEQLLQPVLLLLVGGLLAWLVGSVLGPTYALLLSTGAWS